MTKPFPPQNRASLYEQNRKNTSFLKWGILTILGGKKFLVRKASTHMFPVPCDKDKAVFILSYAEWIGPGLKHELVFPRKVEKSEQ